MGSWFRWLILAGIASITFLEMGIMKSYEIFYVDFTVQIQLSSATAGLAMSSSQGLAYALGVGYSCVYASCHAAIYVYFSDVYEIATGLVLTCAGMGIMVLPLVTEYLGNIYGWRGALLILGGLSLLSVVCGTLLRPVTATDRAENVTAESSRPEDDETTPVCAASCCGAPGHSSSQATHQRTGMDKCVQTLLSACFGFLKLFLTILGVELHASHPLFSMLFISAILFGIGYTTTLTFVISNAVSKGFTLEKAVPLATALGVGNIAGRFVAGFFTERQLLPNSVTACALLMCGAVSFFLDRVVYAYAGLAVLAIVSGFTHGSMTVMITVLPFEDVREHFKSTALYLVLSAFGTGQIIGGYLCGALLQGHSFEFAFTVIGLLELLAGVFLMVPFVVRRIRSRDQETEDTGTQEVEMLLELDG
ncbi:monocarboxylate transporter 12-like [Diadema setosum]|uniref:monocarboxylate transporter 12-like n=1 Tax=Diadema setosum TaxID=31175 RepID=UPI003B3B62AF